MGDLLKFPVQFLPKQKYLENEDSKNLLLPEDHVWECYCSSHLFFLTPNGAKCSNCGVMAQGWCDGVDE